MKVVYRPSDTDEHVWDLDPKRFMAGEREIAERLSGKRYIEWLDDVERGGALSRRVLLWLLLKREHPSLKFSDVDFGWGELELSYTRAELVQVRARLAEAGVEEVNGQPLAQALAALDRAIAEAGDDEGTDVAPGEAPPPTGGTAD
jgi:hypothetical protein